MGSSRFSIECRRAIATALKMMEEEAPVYEVSTPITSSSASKNFWKLRLSGKVNEQFDILFLDNQHKCIACETIAKGTINAAAVYPRVVIQKVLKHNAAAVILGHNHPSGISTPSEADKQITAKLKEACNTIDVTVLDHIVVGDEVYSFSERGIL